MVEWLHPPQVFLALDATTLGNRWTVLALGVVVHQHTIPIAWKVVRGNTKGAWLPLCEALFGVLRGALPKSLPVYALGRLLAAREGQLGGREVGLWDRRRRSASVLLGLMSLVVKCWRAVVRVDSEILWFCSGGEPK
jgi:hypothetical protein